VHADHPIAKNTPARKMPIQFLLNFLLNEMPGKPFPNNIIIPNVINIIPTAGTIQLIPERTMDKVRPKTVASTPMRIKMDENPRKNTKVAKVILFFSLNVIAKYAGNKGNVHGDTMEVMPAKKAIMKEMFCRNCLAVLSLYSWIFNSPIGKCDVA
jgi:hypothetical protein